VPASFGVITKLKGDIGMAKKKWKKPRPLSWVHYDFAGLSDELIRERNTYGLYNGHTYLFLGEIPNALSHCVVVDTRGRFIIGYHVDEFYEIPEDEV
jgi:hypothetical protein